MQTPKLTQTRTILFSALALVVLFAILAFFVTQGYTTSIDEAILHTFHAHIHPVATTIFFSITELGGVISIAALSLISVFVLMRAKMMRLAGFIAASVAGAALLNVGLKELFARTRPELWEQVITETSHSFPSGHAMASMALAACVGFVFYHLTKRRFVWVIAALYTFLVGISRLYFGVHYPTDIVGGWLLGAAWVSVMAVVFFRVKGRKS